MLVITGSGRCGTSVLTKFCQEVGYSPGGAWKDEVNAGMEDKEFAVTNNAIEDGGIDDEIRKYIGEFPRRVVKDPRFLREKAAGAWASLRPDLQVIICVRNMDHVALSFNGTPLGDKSHLEWVTKRTHEIMLAYSSLAKFQVPIRFLSFPHFLDHYKTVHGLLEWGGLPIDYDIGEIAWKKLINKDLVHYK